MKTIHTLVAAVIFSLSFSVYSQTHQKLRIYASDAQLRQLQNQGVCIDHGIRKKGLWFESDFSPKDIQLLNQTGIEYDVLINDVIKFYQDRAWERSGIGNEEELLSTNCEGEDPNYDEPTGFTLGTMAGFYKYAEFIAHLDNMSNTYPNLITPKAQIGSFITHDSNPIYWMRLSDNPTVDENEPEVLYTAIHHAREPESLTQLIFYMYYLLENYGTNDEVTYLVDNTEMYFIPMINPDGYRHNELTNPNGGGLWRKNRRDNGGGEWGVDLNRNYDYHWAYDDIGSSPNPASQTYRGPSGFSEPETQAVKFFTEAHDIQIVLNYHSYGNLLIYPWGYLANIYTPDSAQFVEWSRVMTQENSYTYGTGNQTVGYTVNGDSDDWDYGEQTTKNKIFAYTPEVGSQNDGFWPQVSNIVPLAKDNVRQNLNMAHLALKYAIAQDQTPKVVENLSGHLHFDVMRLGLDSPSTFTVSVIPVGSELTSVGTDKTFINLAMLEKKSDSIAYTLDGSIQQGDPFTYVLKIDNGQFAWEDTLTKFYGTETSLYTNNANDLSDWTTTTWATTTEDFVSSSSSITDSPFQNYNNFDFDIIELTDPVDLSNSLNANLTFWCKWEIETGWDYAQVEASSDGNNWTPLCGLYTKTGNGFQDEGNPLFDGFQTSWVKEEMSLEDFIGGDVHIRFKLVADGGVTEDGFYFDDLEITSLQGEVIGVQEEKPFQPAVFPNPTTDLVTIDIGNDPAPWKLEVYDAVGKLILNRQYNTSRQTINFGTFENGIYSVSISQGNAVTNHKIVTH